MNAAAFRRPERPPDYADRFEGPSAHDGLTARELAMRAMATTPGWFAGLFALRQRLARLIGLKTGAGAAANGLPILGDLPVICDTGDRFQIGMADRHLDFALRVERSPGAVAFATDIWFNGWAGRAYLALVMPAHTAILRRFVRVLGPEGAP